MPVKKQIKGQSTLDGFFNRVPKRPASPRVAHPSKRPSIGSGLGGDPIVVDGSSSDVELVSDSGADQAASMKLITPVPAEIPSAAPVNAPSASKKGKEKALPIHVVPSNQPAAVNPASEYDLKLGKMGNKTIQDLTPASLVVPDLKYPGDDRFIVPWI